MADARKNPRNVRVSRILHERRLELGMTQMEVALRSGIAPQHYQSFETGRRAIAWARMEIGLKICAVLELDPYDLLFSDYTISI